MAYVLENVVANALQHLLGLYFDGIEKNRLKLDVFRGEIHMKNVAIKRDALAAFQLPYKVRWGQVGSLRIKVPWRSLGTQPLEVQIDTLTALIVPIKEWVHADYTKMARLAKEDQVTATLLEEQRAAAKSVSNGFLETLGARVLDNLSVVITKVHIRYEDDFQNPERPFAVDATVARAAWQTTDSEWRIHPHKGKGPVFKRCDVKTLSLSWISEPAEWCESHSDSEIKQMLSDFLTASLADDSPHVHGDSLDADTGSIRKYLLAPVSTTLFMVFKRPEGLAESGDPLCSVRCQLDDVDIQLYEDQYRDLVAGLVYVDVYIRWCRYRKWLPQQSVRKAPRQWWRYAWRCVRFDIDRTRAKTVITKESLSSKLQAWSRYMTLYMRRQGVVWLEPLEPTEERERRAFEDEATVDELIACRQRSDQRFATLKEKVLDRVNVRSPAFPAATTSPSKPASGKATEGKAVEAKPASGKHLAELHAVVHQARGLRSVKDMKYVLIYVDESVYRTNASKLIEGEDGLPRLSWEESATLPLLDHDDFVHILLFEQKLFNDELIGHAVLPVSEIPRAATHGNETRWVKLKAKDGDGERQLGEVGLELSVRAVPGRLRDRLLRERSFRLLARPIVPSAIAESSFEREAARNSTLGCFGQGQHVSGAMRGLMIDIGFDPRAQRQSCSAEGASSERSEGRAAEGSAQDSHRRVRLASQEDATPRGRDGSEDTSPPHGQSTQPAERKHERVHTMPAILWWMHGSLELPAAVVELQIDIRLANGLLNTYTRSPHRKQLACLYVYDWDNRFTIRPSGVEYNSQVRDLELLGRATRLRRLPDEEEDDEDERSTGETESTSVPHDLPPIYSSKSGRVSDPKSTSGAEMSQRRRDRPVKTSVSSSSIRLAHPASCRSGVFGSIGGLHASASSHPGPTPCSLASTKQRSASGCVSPSTSRATLDHMSIKDSARFSSREPRGSVELLSHRASTDGLARVVRRSEVSEHGDASASLVSPLSRVLVHTRFDEADDFMDAEDLGKVPLAKLDLSWSFDRKAKPGIKRSMASLDYLLESEWEADLHLAPLEVRYHHRFVVRLIDFFLSPWDEWAREMEFDEGLVEQMAWLMDSRFSVTLSELDILVMNHILGPNAPLVRAHFLQSSINGEHVVGARASSVLQLALSASYYNPRNRHWEPLLEPWEVGMQMLYKSAAALDRRVDDGGDFFCGDVSCSPLLLNATHAFLESLVTSFTSKYTEKRGSRPRGLHTLDGYYGIGQAEGDFIVSPYWIRNDTGCMLEYQLWHGPVHMMRDAQSHSVGIDTQTPVQIGSAEQQRLQELHHQSALLVRIHFRDEVYVAEGVLFDQVGTRVYLLHRVGDDPWSSRRPTGIPGGIGSRLMVVGEVRARANGTNVLTIRSSLRFYNATDTTIEMRIFSSSAADRHTSDRLPPLERERPSESRESMRSDTNGQREVALLLPQETWAVPLGLLQDLKGGVSLRPTRDRYVWSRKSTFGELAEGRTFLVCEQESRARRSIVSRDSLIDKPKFYLNVDLEIDQLWDAEQGGDTLGTSPQERDYLRANQPRTISFYAPYVIYNNLAVGMNFSIRSKGSMGNLTARLERGDKLLVHVLDPSRPIGLNLEVDGFNRSTTATFKPTFRPERKPSAYSMQRLRHMAKLLPELSNVFSGVSKVKMNDRSPRKRPLNVHLDTWEGIGNTFNIVAFTTYWLVNKSGLPLAFRRMIPSIAGGKIRPETAVNEEDGGEQEEVPLLDAMESGGPSVNDQLHGEPTPYNPIEVTSGPLMISYTRPNWEWPFNNASVKVQGDTGWSRSFQLDLPTTMSIDSRRGGSYELGIDCKFAPEPFHRTRLVFICPRFIIANETSLSLLYCQAGMEASAQTVYPQSEVIFHWPSNRNKQLLRVRWGREGDRTLWSTPFLISSGENFVVKVRRPARDQWAHLHVEVKLVEPVVFVIFREGLPEHAPIMLQNKLREEVAVFQKGVKHNADRVAPGEVLPFVWDCPLERRLILVLAFGTTVLDPKAGVRKEVTLDNRSQELEIKLPANASVHAIPAQTVKVNIDAVDCQRTLITFQEVTNARNNQLARTFVPWSSAGNKRSPAKVGASDAQQSQADEHQRRAAGLDKTIFPACGRGRQTDPSSSSERRDRSESLFSAHGARHNHDAGVSRGLGAAGERSRRRPSGFLRPGLPAQPLVHVHDICSIACEDRDADCYTTPGTPHSFVLRGILETPDGRKLGSDEAGSPHSQPRLGNLRHSMYGLGNTIERRGKRQEIQLLNALLETKTARRSLSFDQDQLSGICAHEYLWDKSQTRRQEIALSLKCESMQVSIVDGSPTELLYITVSNLSIYAAQGANEDERADGSVTSTAVRYQQRLQLELGSLQVDNQRYNTAYPVTLAMSAEPALAFRAVRDISFRKRAFVYLPLLQLHVQPMSIMLDEESMRAFAAFLDVFSTHETLLRNRDASPQPATLFEHSMLIPTQRAISPGTRVLGRMFVEEISISLISLRATWKRSPSGAAHLTLNPLLAVFNSLTTALINIDDAPIHFKQLHKMRFFSGPEELGRKVVRHYRSELWRVVIAVALSLDCFGKPYESITDLQYAFIALFCKPLMLLFVAPSKAPFALLQGLLELLKVLVRVPFNALSKILQAWAKGLALLSLDPEFTQRRLQETEFRRAANIYQGLQQGIARLLASLISAVVGFYRQAMRGFNRHGAHGVLIGLARAPVGLVTKPIVGTLDLISKILEGVKNTVRVLPVTQQRVRPPRIFHADRLLREFSLAEAKAQSMLQHCRTITERSLSGEQDAEQEYYVDHFSVTWTRRSGTEGSPKLLLITSQRVVFGDELRLRPIWETRIERIARVELKPGYVMLWTWEKFGPSTPTYSYNIVVERILYCNDPNVLMQLFARLWSVANQRGSHLDPSGPEFARAAGGMQAHFFHSRERQPICSSR